jgi:hypothetical protein
MPRTLRTTFFWLWLYCILAFTQSKMTNSGWNREVERAAMQHHLENTSPNQEEQREQEEEEEEEGSGEAAVQQHCEIVEKDQEDLERRELEEQNDD